MSVTRVLLVICLPVPSLLVADELLVPDDYETIQEAVDAAEDGDTIEVSSGVYEENVDLLGKNLTLFAPDGPEDTIVIGDTATLGDDDQSVFKIVDADEVVIDGFTLRDGVGTSDVGAGSGARTGGALYCLRSTLLVKNCAIEQNSAWAIHLRDDAIVTIEDSTVSENPDGGIEVLLGGELFLERCVLEDNESLVGGAVYVGFDATGEISHCEFRRNSALIGGGCTLAGEDCRLVDSYFESNEATYGGAASVTGDAVVERCKFVRNDASFGGGVIVSGATTFVGCLFAANEAGSGGAIAAESEGTSTFTNCTLASNVASTSGPAVWTLATTGTGGPYVTLVNGIVWDHGDDPFGDPDRVTATYSNIEGDYDGDGNIDEDPLFVNEDEDDYSLQEDSPCIDAGDPDSESDPDGTTTDMGAYYYRQEPIFRRGDVDSNGSTAVLLDALFLLEWSFSDGEEPLCLEAADVNDSGSVDALTDALRLLQWGFANGDAPPDPGPDECGFDSSDDDLDCAEEPDCSAP